MLKLLNLEILNKIFEQLGIDEFSHIRSFYINCLIFRFKNLDATFESARAFDINECIEGFVLQKSKHQHLFYELRNKGLVQINNNQVTFINLWGKYIPKDLYEEKKKEEPPQFTYWFRVEGKIKIGKVSEYIEKEFSNFLQVFLIQNNSHAHLEFEVMQELDAECNCKDFENDNHIRNSFITKFKYAKQQSSNNGKKFTTNYNERKASLHGLAERANAFAKERESLLNRASGEREE
jgi:hypothetical protein